jgi:hypothetical protein
MNELGAVTTVGFAAAIYNCAALQQHLVLQITTAAATAAVA